MNRELLGYFCFALLFCFTLPRNFKIRIKTELLFRTENNMCNFIDIKDSITELRIVSGTKESSLQEASLRETDLEKCLQTARTVELFKGKKANIIIAINTEQVHHWFELKWQC